MKQEINETEYKNPGALWKGVKRVLQWKDGGAPSELKNKTGEIIDDPQLIAEVIHNTFENKVESIILQNELFIETQEEEVYNIPSK